MSEVTKLIDEARAGRSTADNFLLRINPRRSAGELLGELADALEQSEAGLQEAVARLRALEAGHELLVTQHAEQANKLEQSEAGAAAMRAFLEVNRIHRPSCRSIRPPDDESQKCDCGREAALADPSGQSFLERLRRAEEKAKTIEHVPAVEHIESLEQERDALKARVQELEAADKESLATLSRCSSRIEALEEERDGLDQLLELKHDLCAPKHDVLALAQECETLKARGAELETDLKDTIDRREEDLREQVEATRRVERAKVDEWERCYAIARGEVSRLLTLVTELEEQKETQRLMLARCIDESSRLRAVVAAFRDWAIHRPNCAALRSDPPYLVGSCDCGLEALALADAPAGEAEPDKWTWPDAAPRIRNCLEDILQQSVAGCRGKGHGDQCCRIHDAAGVALLLLESGMTDEQLDAGWASPEVVAKVRDLVPRIQASDDPDALVDEILAILPAGKGGAE